MTWVDSAAVLWFLTLWGGYTFYAKRKAKTVSCLSFEMRRKRNHWMQQMLSRENKMADVALISTLERNVSFFASSTLLILAGLLTALVSSGSLAEVLAYLAPWREISKEAVQMKILFLAVIYVFAFFQFTWALRQYGFAGVLITSAPDGKNLTTEELGLYASRTSKVVDLAGHSFNYGLRAIYFSLATLSWFIDPVLFMATSIVVLAVMRHREFHSKVLKALQQC